jgi:hypothetical protein
MIAANEKSEEENFGRWVKASKRFPNDPDSVRKRHIKSLEPIDEVSEYNDEYLVLESGVEVPYNKIEWFEKHQKSEVKVGSKIIDSRYPDSRPMTVKPTHMSNEKTGIELISEERQEQLGKHGRTIQKDVEINHGHYELEGEKMYSPQLPHAALLLLYQDNQELMRPNILDGSFMPHGWDKTIWLKMANKPYKERLIIAGALIAAEIDRLQYLQKTQP